MVAIVVKPKYNPSRYIWLPWSYARVAHNCTMQTGGNERIGYICLLNIIGSRLRKTRQESCDAIVNARDYHVMGTSLCSASSSSVHCHSLTQGYKYWISSQCLRNTHVSVPKSSKTAIINHAQDIIWSRTVTHMTNYIEDTSRMNEVTGWGKDLMAALRTSATFHRKKIPSSVSCTGSWLINAAQTSCSCSDQSLLIGQHEEIEAFEWPGYKKARQKKKKMRNFCMGGTGKRQTHKR